MMRWHHQAWKCLFLLFLGIVFSAITVFAETRTVRAPPSEMPGGDALAPEIDHSKTVEMKAFDMDNLGGPGGGFQTKELEMKAADLPTYPGNLKMLPLTEWQSPKSDFYSKSINLRDFEIKKAVERWSQHSDQFQQNEGSSLPQKNYDPYSREADVPASPVEKKEVDPAPNLSGEKLKQLINQGGELGPVQVGRGFGATQLGPQLKETPETKSPPKSGTSP